MKGDHHDGNNHLGHRGTPQGTTRHPQSRFPGIVRPSGRLSRRLQHPRAAHIRPGERREPPHGAQRRRFLRGRQPQHAAGRSGLSTVRLRDTEHPGRGRAPLHHRQPGRRDRRRGGPPAHQSGRTPLGRPHRSHVPSAVLGRPGKSGIHPRTPHVRRCARHVGRSHDGGHAGVRGPLHLPAESACQHGAPHDGATGQDVPDRDPAILPDLNPHRP